MYEKKYYSGVKKMNFKSKYSLGQKVYRIYQLGDAWYSSKYILGIIKVSFRSTKEGIKIYYGTLQHSNATAEEDLFPRKEDAKNECDKRNIITELRR